jgi:hypothetical protein
MLQWAGSPLRQEQAHAVVTHWDDIVQHLAPPSVSWAWAECPLAPATKHKLKERDLIERSGGGRWSATADLWQDVIDRAAPDESVGESAVGQETLPVSPRRRLSTRRADPSLRDDRGPCSEQVTLTGDAVGANPERAFNNTGGEDDGEGGRDPGQFCLSVFASGQTTLRAWVTGNALTPA